MRLPGAARELDVESESNQAETLNRMYYSHWGNQNHPCPKVLVTRLMSKRDSLAICGSLSHFDSFSVLAR